MNELMRKMLGLPEQASTVAAEIDALHYFVITVTMLGALFVTLAAIWFIFRYRADRPDRPERPERDTPGGFPIWLELSVVVGLLGLFVLWWVLGFRQYVHLREPPRDALEVYVIGKKWMWTFAYPQGGGSNGVLYVPAGRPVKLVLTSRDVIHSFFVPQFRIKQDAVPGRATIAWFEARRPGTYDLYCTEYCGQGHSTMRARVVVLSPEDYERQLEGLAPPEVAAPEFPVPVITGDVAPREPVTLAEVGKRVAADKGCLRCHTVDGTPHIGPSWAGLYGRTIPLAGGGEINADEAYLTESMMDPTVRVHLGFQPVMPSFQGLLSAGEAGALVEYIRSLRAEPLIDGWDPLPLSVEGPVPLVQPEPVQEEKLKEAAP